MPESYDLLLEKLLEDPDSIENVDLQKEGLTPEKITELYYTLIQNTWRVIRKIPREQVSYDMCLEAVASSGGEALRVVLEFMHDDKQKHDLFLAAVDIDSDVISLIPENVSFEDYKDVFLKAMTHNGSLLGSLSLKEKTAEICHAAVRKTYTALNYVPTPEVEGSLLTSKDYIEICREATQKDLPAFQFVDQKYKSEVSSLFPQEFYLNHVQKDWKKVKYVPINQLTEKVASAAVIQHPDALNDIPKPGMKDSRIDLEAYKRIYVKAVLANPFALQFVPEEFKSHVIDTVSLETILSYDYQLKNFFPKEPNYTSKINQFLSEIKHVVLTSYKLDAAKQAEMKDSYLIYSNLPKRLGKTIHTTKANAQDLLNDLQKVCPQNRSVELVLLDYFTAIKGNEMVGMSPEKITNLLKQYTAIGTLKCFGCNTVKSLETEEEKELVFQFRKAQESLKKERCGFVLMSHEPHLSEYANLFEKKKSKKKKSNEDKHEAEKEDKKALDSVYVLSKTSNTQQEQYKLTLLSKNSDSGAISVQSFTLENTDFELLEKVLTQGKTFAFPTPSRKNPNPAPNPFRGKNEDYLSANELDNISEITTDVSKFLKTHPDYAQTKKQFPFLRRMEMSPEEAEKKLQPSFLQEIFKRIQNDSALKNEGLALIAFTGHLLAETLSQSTQKTKSSLYDNPNYPVSLFGTQATQVNLNALSGERLRGVKEMRNREPGEEKEKLSDAKSIKIKFGNSE